jgi:hypothetical protein
VIHHQPNIGAQVTCTRHEGDKAVMGDLFLNENLNHPENRINVALFGLMTQDWLREWILARLDLPTNAVIYPPTNEDGIRPDFKVADPNGSPLAWIEVELGSNAAQIEVYKGRKNEPIKTIWGRPRHAGDLSLEEIASHISGHIEHHQKLSPQVSYNARHLRDQIIQSLDGFKSGSSVRAPLADAMREHPVVKGLTDRIGANLLFQLGRVPAGFLGVDTTKPQGFSLRAPTRLATSGTVSVMYITAGRPEVGFAPDKKLRRYLPLHLDAIDEYARVLRRHGLDITVFVERGKPTLPNGPVIEALDELAPCLLTLSRLPER